MSASAIVTIPVYRPHPSNLEQFCLDRCLSILGRHPIGFFGPETLDFSSYQSQAPGARVFRFADRYFRSKATYSELLVQPSFYRAFAGFDYLLLHQLDAFVFEDRLEEWCIAGWDYVGAPWLGPDGHWKGVGNGGFSLRRIDSHMEVLRSRRRLPGAAFWEHVVVMHSKRLDRLKYILRTIMYDLGIRNDLESVLAYLIHVGDPEDVFWGVMARHWHPGFKVPPPELAIHFSVEDGLRQARDQIDRAPFGGHQAWLVDMVRRLMEGHIEPRDQCERLVWEVACRAGLGESARLAQPAQGSRCSCPRGWLP